MENWDFFSWKDGVNCFQLFKDFINIVVVGLLSVFGSVFQKCCCLSCTDVFYTGSEFAVYSDILTLSGRIMVMGDYVIYNVMFQAADYAHIEPLFKLEWCNSYVQHTWVL